jgi:hypothetical protein
VSGERERGDGDGKWEQYLCNVSLKFTFVNINIREGSDGGESTHHIPLLCVFRLLPLLLQQRHTYFIATHKNLSTLKRERVSERHGRVLLSRAYYANEECRIGRLADCLFAATTTAAAAATAKFSLLILSFFCAGHKLPHLPPPRAPFPRSLRLVINLTVKNPTTAYTLKQAHTAASLLSAFA